MDIENYEDVLREHGSRIDPQSKMKTNYIKDYKVQNLKEADEKERIARIISQFYPDNKLEALELIRKKFIHKQLYEFIILLNYETLAMKRRKQKNISNIISSLNYVLEDFAEIVYIQGESIQGGIFSGLNGTFAKKVGGLKGSLNR